MLILPPWLRTGASTSGSGVSDSYIPRDPTGSDKFLDWSAGSDGSGTSGSPYNTWTSARNAALSAGQQLVVTGQGAWPDCTGAADGTTNSRIVVRAHPSFPTTSGFTFSGNGARLGGCDYWDFYSLTLAAVNNGLCLAQDYAFNGGNRSNYFRAIDCVGTRSSNSLTDNSGIIFASNGDDGHITGLEVIRGSYTGTAGGTQNQSGIWADYVSAANFLGVLIDQFSNPIYFKHTDTNSSGTPGGVVKNCIIRRAGRGLQASINWLQFINNALDACILGMDESGGGTAGGNNWTLTHNSLLNSDVTLAITDSGVTKHLNNTLRNNAWLGTSRFQDNPFGANSNEDQNNSSDYSACAGAATNHFYRNGTQRTLAQHQAAFGTQEVHGVAGTITLVGGSTPGSTAANWAIQSGTGIGAASDGADCGVDATKLLTIN